MSHVSDCVCLCRNWSWMLTASRSWTWSPQPQAQTQVALENLMPTMVRTRASWICNKSRPKSWASSKSKENMRAKKTQWRSLALPPPSRVQRALPVEPFKPAACPLDSQQQTSLQTINRVSSTLQSQRPPWRLQSPPQSPLQSPVSILPQFCCIGSLSSCGTNASHVRANFLSLRCSEFAHPAQHLHAQRVTSTSRFSSHRPCFAHLITLRRRSAASWISAQFCCTSSGDMGT